ncbi:phage/plasmid replication domain-containing protein [Pedobacter cryotolerans]|uniref:Replication-associated protein G2P N-terminal domain-containing protein n=1 Tax=Pedobacter cryotolerans TaxID=2571270 RepID=A0A4U1CAB8_9SPHI|nr:phage/plasmid replication protein [Pedobacter cryotolerans]TKC01399.1 hypothetical protein FA045_09185 [Pedobacter cryotolerans]
MIDTIRIKIELNQLPENYYSFLQSKIIRKRYFTNEFGRTTLICNYENFYITLGLTGLFITGSLTRYVKGNTLETAYKDELFNGLLRLGIDLMIDIMDAKVLRLDIAGNILTKKPVEEYFSILSSFKRTERFRHTNALTYSNSYRKILFYNKIKQLQIKRSQNIDQILKDNNVLRYEYRFCKTNTLQRFLSINDVTVHTIFDNYEKLVNSWVDNYLSIDKSNEPKFFDEKVFDKKGMFYKQLQLEGIKALGGMNMILEMIDISKKKGAFNKYPNQITNIKARLRSLMNNPVLVKISALNEELTSKIMMFGFYATQ